MEKCQGPTKVTQKQRLEERRHITVTTLMIQEGAHDNICLTDSDEEAIVDFVKDHEDLYDKTCGRASPTVATCLSKCVRPGVGRKGHVMTSS